MQRIVIVGGGFAGVKCARVLRKQAPRNVDVVLFSRDNHMVFQPLLADVAGSSLNPRAVAAPLRQLLPGVQCRNEEVTEVDLDNGALGYVCHDGSTRRLDYDHLVIACGNQVNLNLLPGMANHALPLKTIGDAIAMRAHVMQQIEKADLAETADQRRFYLTFIVVGGGFSGVEVAGEINDLLHSALKHYPNLRRDDIGVTLLHGTPQILPEVNPRLRDYARERMERAGVRVLTDTRVVEVTAQGATLGDGARVRGATVICTVGTTAMPLVARLDVPKERGRIAVAADMRLPGRDNVWAIGDCAMVVNAFDAKPAPPTAQFAEREGCQTAQNILRALRGEATQAFRHKPIGSACGIGGRRGVAELYGVRISGFFAWWLWRSAFLAKLPSMLQKIKVGIDWAWELVFPRDLSHFRPTLSDPIGRAYFSPGDELFRRGQPLKHWFAIASGEAEVVVRDAMSGEDRVVMTLGPGTLAGSATLDELDEADARVRARSAVEAVTLGRESLARMSAVLQPVQALLERGVARPPTRIWRHHPQALQALSKRRAGELPMRAQPLQLNAAATLGQAYGLLIEHLAGCVLVTREGRLAGIVTRSDLLAAFARGATRDTQLATCMNPKPLFVRGDESAALAAELMADRDLKFLPVCDAEQRISGLLSADDFVALALALPRADSVPAPAAVTNLAKV